jgi:hypothetical protein
MITAIIGTISEIEEDGSIRGNGKNITETYYLYQDFLQGRKIFTNYYTTFSEQLPLKEIIQKILDNYQSYKKGVSIGITETQVSFDSMGSPKAQTEFIMWFIQQSRKTNTDIYYDTQRLADVNKKLRVQTDNILQPVKIHSDGKLCPLDRCPRLDHFIKVYSLKPYRNKPITGNIVIDCSRVGKMYKTNQLVFDKMVIEKPKKLKMPNRRR